MSAKTLIKLIALITVAAFTATNCGISYAVDTCEIRQVQLIETAIVSSSSDNRIKKWRETKPAKLPDDEDISVKYLVRLSCLDWITINEAEIALLKGFVIEAQNVFPKILSDKIINDALFSSDGVFELVRRSHPYTLQVLSNPGLFTYHFRWHVGEYYRLFALKLMEKGPQDPLKAKIVFCVDPHKDYMGNTETGDKLIRKEGIDISRRDDRYHTYYNIHTVHGVSNANFASAIVRDGLADKVIMAYGFPERPLFKWYFFAVSKSDSPGDTISESPEWVTANEFGHLVDKIMLEFLGFTSLQFHWTVDLDQFGLRPEDGKRQPVFLEPEAIPQQLTFLLKNLKHLQPYIVSLTTADSRNHLVKEADEIWIAGARQAVKNAFETNLAYEVKTPGSEMIDARAAGYKTESATSRSSL